MSKELKVGFIALVSGALLYYGFNFLKGIDFFSPTNKYYVLYENVDGLNKSNPVIINGLTVGRVSRIRLLQNYGNEILVELDIDEDISLGTKTVASLSNLDFLGSKGIVLDVGSLDNLIEPGDTLQAKVDNVLNELIASAEPVASNLNTTITRVNEILIGLKGSGERVSETLGQVQKTSESVNEIIAQNQVTLAEIMVSTAQTIAKLNEKLDRVDPMAAKTEELLDSLTNLQLNETLATVRAAVDNLNATVTQLTDEKGTLGKLVSNDSVYVQLNQTLTDLDKLLIHMDQYPKHFFSPLGKSHKKVMKDMER